MSANWWPRHEQDEIEAVERVLRSGKTNYWSGSEGVEFEKEFAAYTGARHALTCSSGTTALELALHSLRLPPGARVLVPCRTFAACASAVVNAGLVPVFTDIEAPTLNVSADTLNAADEMARERTHAAIVVHYAGQPADMDKIMQWAWERNVRIIEDCAHAHGARIDGRHVGTFGDVGCFSMCVGKIMSTGGEGGMVVTDKPWLAQRMRARRDHGRYQMVGSGTDLSTFKYTVTEAGTNARMSEMQSAIGRCQLQKLDDWNRQRAVIARVYDEELTDRWAMPLQADGGVYYMYLGRAHGWLRKKLIDAGVGAKFGGCPNLGLEPAFAKYATPCAAADSEGERVFSLPIYPTMGVDEARKIGRKAFDILSGG